MGSKNKKKLRKKNQSYSKQKKSKYSLKTISIISFSAVIIIGFLLYIHTFHVPFYYDDYDSIIDNPDIKNLKNFVSLPDFLTGISSRYISRLSFALNFHFGSLNVFGYHLINILIHAVNTLLVMIFIYNTLNSQVLKDSYDQRTKVYFASMVGLIFAVHPIQTQAVTYIVQRMTSLSTLFYLLSLILYIKARLIFMNPQLTKVKKYIFISLLLCFSIFSTVFGMWSKQIAATLPFVIILYEITFLRNSNNQISWRIIIPLFISILIAVIYFLLNVGIPIEADEVPRKVYMLTQINVIVSYLKLLIYPLSQNLDYEFPFTKSLFESFTLINLIIILSLIIVGIRLIKKKPLISFSILWFFITLSVESSIIPIRDVMVEQRLYLPMVGFSLLIVTVLRQYLTQKKLLLTLVFSFITIFYSILTFQRNSLWNDPIAMWSDTISKSPNKLRPRFARGNVFLYNNQIDNAIYDYQKVLEINKDYYLAYINLAYAYLEKKDYQTAIKFCDEAIRIKPHSYMAYNNRATAYIYLKKYELALEDLKKAISYGYQYTDAIYNLGLVYYNLGKYGEAASYFEKAYSLNPTYNNNSILANCYYKTGNYNKAWEQINYLRSIGIEPAKSLVQKLEQVDIKKTK